ncbi:MAG: hypothetical protein M3Z31_16090 [Pseudomonadota bacterium]|nr:hypothetical protein [Pseudomonadota bacterium]
MKPLAPPDTFRLRAPERAALALALVIAHAFYWRIVLFPSAFDAQNYLEIAEDITRKGLFANFFYSNIRTYGYPLFLATVREVSGGQWARWTWLVFEIQLALFIMAALALRRALRVWDERFARASFMAVVLNVFVLSYTPETLSESISVTLLIAAIACWLRARAAPAALWPALLLGSVFISLSVMVRPANVFALATWIVATALLGIERRLRLGAWLALLVAVAIGIAVPMAPQYANNVRYHGEHTPLVVARLGTNQQVWGIQYIKYATAMPPVPLPSVFYANPFARERPVDPVHPLHWYRDHPVAGLATMGLHVFDMLDQDLFFTYSRNLDPWYRWPVGVLNHALIALALMGAALLFGQWRTRAVACIALATLVIAHVAVHATAAVEMRFGLPLLALAGPLAVWPWMRISAGPSGPPRLFVLAVFVLAYVVGALALSEWVRKQSTSIVAWQQAHSAPEH